MKKPSPAKKTKSEAAQQLDAEKVRVSTANVQSFNTLADMVTAPAEFALPEGGLPAAQKFLGTLFQPGDVIVYSADLFNIRTSTVASFKPSWPGSRRGVYVKVNRMVVDEPTGNNGGVRDQDCATDFVMLELDKCPKEDQLLFWKLLIGMGLPVLSLVDSAGKSLHAVIGVQAHSASEYRTFALALAELLEPFLPDTTSLNPSRFTRLPGFTRSGAMQNLLYLNPIARLWNPELSCNAQIRSLCAGLEPVPLAVHESMSRAISRNHDREETPESGKARKEFNEWSGGLPLNGVLDMAALIGSLGWASCDSADTRLEKKFYIQCPWSGEHGGGGDTDGPKDAYIYERKTSARFKWGFHCSHDACRTHGRTIKEVFELLIEEHGEVVQEAVVPHADVTDYFEDEPGETKPVAELPEPPPANVTEVGLPDEPAVIEGTGALLALMPGEHADAELLMKIHGTKLKFLHDEQRWLIWKKGVWQRDFVEAIKEKAKTVGRIRLEKAKSDEEKEIAARSMSSKMIEGVLKTVRSIPSVAVLSDKLDTNPWLLGCLNGVLDLRTMKVGPGDPKDLVSLRLGVKFNPAADGARWRSSTDEMFPRDPEVLAFLKRFFGHALWGKNPEQKMLILHGHGRNGKSTMLDTIQKVLGEYGINSPKGLLIANPRGDDPNAASPAVADLKGKRLACVSETEAEAKLAEAKLKDILSGEQVRARQMYEGYQTIRPIAKLVLSSNHLPKISGTDTGIWRRILVADFGEDFRGREDLSLDVVLENELEGVLNWLLEGYLDYMEHGLMIPAKVLAATEELRRSMDVLGLFLSDACQQGVAEKCLSKDLYETYRNWCHHIGTPAWSAITFGRRLKDRGFKSVQTHGYQTWAGLSLPPTPLP